MDPKKLDFVNGEYIHAMTDADFAEKIMLPQLVAQNLEREGALAHDASWYALLASALKPRTTLSADVVAQARYLYTADDKLELDEKATKKWLGKQGAHAALEAARDALAALDDASWEPAAIEAALDPIPERLEMGKGKVFQPIRVACVGSAASPGIGETLALLGREHTLARIERALPLAQ
jgi:glutamyl-tRNA synthetase